MSGSIWIINQDVWLQGHYLSNDIMIWIWQPHLLAVLFLAHSTPGPPRATACVFKQPRNSSPSSARPCTGYRALWIDHGLTCQNFLIYDTLAATSGPLYHLFPLLGVTSCYGFSYNVPSCPSNCSTSDTSFEKQPSQLHLKSWCRHFSLYNDCVFFHIPYQSSILYLYF